jgi:hypothetical protein
MQTSESSLTLARPAIYRLHVQGYLDQSWSAQLDLTIKTAHDAGGHPVTELTGRLADQAALMGVIDWLYLMGLPLLLVECLELEPTA